MNNQQTIKPGFRMHIKTRFNECDPSNPIKVEYQCFIENLKEFYDARINLLKQYFEATQKGINESSTLLSIRSDSTLNSTAANHIRKIVIDSTSAERERELNQWLEEWAWNKAEREESEENCRKL